jgi:RNA polymerase primary sigma factor
VSMTDDLAAADWPRRSPRFPRRHSGAAPHDPLAQVPRLSRTDERALVQRAQDGDAAARDRLVDAYLPAIAGVARIYRRAPAVDRHELMQEGVVGLLHALERFECERDTPFWAYASWWVRQAMQQLTAELTGPIVLSDRALRQLARVRGARRRYLQEQVSDPSPSELASAVGVTREEVERLLAVERTPRALDEPLPGDGGHAEPRGLPDPAAEDGYEHVLRQAEIDEVRGRFDILDHRARGILEARFGLVGESRTLREIASGLGISAERVRQIEQQALTELREATAAG